MQSYWSNGQDNWWHIRDKQQVVRDTRVMGRITGGTFGIRVGTEIGNLRRTKTSSWRARRSPGVRPEGAAEVKAARARAAASPESAPWAASRCCIPPSAASPKPPPPQPHRSPGPRLSATLVVAEVGTTTVGVVRRDGNCF
ncbi:Protein of unknown function [Gryllus bimaculatus]|nr:Protein of unknown function [Gryllus bimaculatus]